MCCPLIRFLTFSEIEAASGFSPVTTEMPIASSVSFTQSATGLSLGENDCPRNAVGRNAVDIWPTSTAPRSPSDARHSGPVAVGRPALDVAQRATRSFGAAQ